MVSNSWLESITRIITKNVLYETVNIIIVPDLFKLVVFCRYFKETEMLTISQLMKAIGLKQELYDSSSQHMWVNRV